MNLYGKLFLGFKNVKFFSLENPIFLKIALAEMLKRQGSSI